jgi:NAD(P)-dependent dehydrogenase (short-subunit alcohol dehydrogenase family)
MGRTVFITGASRGIGKAIALKVAKDGANVVIAAKTAEPHPKLPGTIYTAAEEGMHSTSQSNLSLWSPAFNSHLSHKAILFLVQ